MMVVTVHYDPVELRKFLAADTAKWEGVVTKLGLKIN
jgi:hypothetical protein